MIVRVTPEAYIDTDKFQCATLIGTTDQYKDQHVIVYLDDSELEFDSSYKLTEIVAALKNGCYYRSQYLDQAGHVDICVVHEDISESDDWRPHRFCRVRSPKPIYFPLSSTAPSERVEEAEKPLGPIARYLAKKGRS